MRANHSPARDPIMHNRRHTTIIRFLWVLITAVSVSVLVPADEPTPSADSMRGKEVGDVHEDNGLTMKLVWCPRGEFTMEVPGGQVQVIFSEGYWLGAFEVTQSEWVRVMATEPWKGRNRTKEGDRFPATWVDWEDSIRFCRKLTEQERMAGRLPRDWEYTLPTEAQWYRACTAGSETQFSFGDDESKLGEYAWFADNTTGAGEDYAHAVGQKKPNAWGLHDMHGNAAEWCRDHYVVSLTGGRDPEVTEPGADHVLRGDGWRYTAAGCRSTKRRGSDPSNRFADIGFRVALTRIRPAVNDPAR